MFEIDCDYTFFCGYAGSGKSTIAKVYAEWAGATFVEVSDIVKRVLNENKRSEIGNRPELDVQIIAELKKVETPAVISGVRQLSIIEAFPNSPVTFVGVPFAVRESRINSRGDEKDNVELLDADAFDDQLGLNEIAEAVVKMRAVPFNMKGE